MQNKIFYLLLGVILGKGLVFDYAQALDVEAVISGKISKHKKKKVMVVFPSDLGIEVGEILYVFEITDAAAIGKKIGIIKVTKVKGKKMMGKIKVRKGISSAELKAALVVRKSDYADAVGGKGGGAAARGKKGAAGSSGKQRASIINLDLSLVSFSSARAIKEAMHIETPSGVLEDEKEALNLKYAFMGFGVQGAFFPLGFAPALAQHNYVGLGATFEQGGKEPQKVEDDEDVEKASPAEPVTEFFTRRWALDTYLRYVVFFGGVMSYKFYIKYTPVAQRTFSMPLYQYKEHSMWVGTRQEFNYSYFSLGFYFDYPVALGLEEVKEIEYILTLNSQESQYVWGVDFGANLPYSKVVFFYRTLLHGVELLYTDRSHDMAMTNQSMGLMLRAYF